jgi:hypothetical protein
MMSEFFPALERWVPKYVDLASQHLIKMAGDDADKKAQLETDRKAQISLWNSTIKKWSDPKECPEVPARVLPPALTLTATVLS